MYRIREEDIVGGVGGIEVNIKWSSWGIILRKWYWRWDLSDKEVVRGVGREEYFIRGIVCVKV